MFQQNRLQPTIAGIWPVKAMPSSLVEWTRWPHPKVEFDLFKRNMVISRDDIRLHSRQENSVTIVCQKNITRMFKPTGGKPNQRFACFYVFHGVKGVGWGGLITFICTTSHTWWYATVSLLALPHIHDATLLYVFLHFLTYMMLRYCNFSCTSAHIYIYDATLPYVFLHFRTYMMLRYCKSSCTSSHTWCYATPCLLALPHIHDATLL